MWEVLILLFIVLLLFGAKRLPEIGGSLGKGRPVPAAPAACRADRRSPPRPSVPPPSDSRSSGTAVTPAEASPDL
ncbi:MAG: twin-arginine translocase TatA/TatE family subunit [Gemmatimonadota bacterium]